MHRARLLGVPFWPAASILEVPSLIFRWQEIAAEAEERARPILEERARRKAAHEAAMRGNGNPAS